MAVGFLGALITLGAVALVVTPGTAAGPALMAAGSMGLVGGFAVVLRRQLAPFTATMAAGVVLLLAGNVLWALGWAIPQVVPFWGGFLLLTIAGERLELSRMAMPGQRAVVALSAFVLAYLAGTATTVFAAKVGAGLTGLATVGLTLWSVRFDVARRTIRGEGLPRFAAACMLTGYVWLAVHGVLSLSSPTVSAGPLYDARWHALFLGFVFAMIFGHARSM